jgi:hypothetical protein
MPSDAETIEQRHEFRRSQPRHSGVQRRKTGGGTVTMTPTVVGVVGLYPNRQEGFAQLGSQTVRGNDTPSSRATGLDVPAGSLNKDGQVALKRGCGKRSPLPLAISENKSRLVSPSTAQVVDDAQRDPRGWQPRTGPAGGPARTAYAELTGPPR